MEWCAVLIILELFDELLNISKEISSSFYTNSSSLKVTYLQQCVTVLKANRIFNQLVSYLTLFESVDII